MGDEHNIPQLDEEDEANQPSNFRAESDDEFENLSEDDFVQDEAPHEQCVVVRKAVASTVSFVSSCVFSKEPVWQNDYWVGDFEISDDEESQAGEEEVPGAIDDEDFDADIVWDSVPNDVDSISSSGSSDDSSNGGNEVVAEPPIITNGFRSNPPGIPRTERRAASSVDERMPSSLLPWAVVLMHMQSRFRAPTSHTAAIFKLISTVIMTMAPPNTMLDDLAEDLSTGVYALFLTQSGLIYVFSAKFNLRTARIAFDLLEDSFELIPLCPACGVAYFDEIWYKDVDGVPHPKRCGRRTQKVRLYSCILPI